MTVKQLSQLLDGKLKHLASKIDLKKFATKDDLKKFATKDDIKRMATKNDIRKIRKDIKELRSAMTQYAVDTHGRISLIESHLGISTPA